MAGRAVDDVDISALLDGVVPMTAPVVLTEGQVLAVPWLPQLLACTACSCRLGALRVVPGRGPLDARVMVIGQSPGVVEDRRGQAFCADAPSGGLLNRWLETLGFVRDRIWVTNCCKCRAPEDRKPTALEAKTCATLWLTRELYLLPELRLIIPLGETALTQVLGPHAEKVSALKAYTRRVVLAPEIAGPDALPARVLYVAPLPHPAYILRAEYQGGRVQQMLVELRTFLSKELSGVYA